MKKLFLAAAILFAFSAQSQVIDTTVTSIAACKVNEFKVAYTDTANAYYLGVRSISDNLSSSCVLYWIIMDQKQNKLWDGNATITGDDYTAWNGSNLFPFVFVGRKYSITFKQ